MSTNFHRHLLLIRCEESIIVRPNLTLTHTSISVITFLMARNSIYISQLIQEISSASRALMALEKFFLDDAGNGLAKY